MANATKIRKTTIAMPNKIFAMPAVAEETPEKPKNPATTEITAAIKAHFNMAKLKQEKSVESVGSETRPTI